MVESVLIANRGEIAVRVARSARALGVRAIAVFSDADAGAPHVAAADEAVRIGPAPAAESYLSIDAILAAAVRTGAAAIHPGYGFLSENAAFARACADAGLAFVGPPADAIELMGDKARAKAAARDAGVPVVPGVEGADLDLAEIAAFCDEHGLPVVVKALAGGGGRGMRVVRERGELEEAVAAARREAAAAFGDDRVLVERYLDRPRHIEVQVMADGYGGCVHLGERECSLQRRHQKVVEEAPSPVVGPDLRERMGAAAVALAQACGYVGAGTVELIAPSADPSDFAFLEMNTRLQVEHPVTELVYGVDLVAEQLRVASGERLSIDQAAVVPRGHAVEARVYAEDPAAGFLPATGTLRRWRVPDGPGLRLDAGVAAGGAVTTHYDPLLAKAIAHGPDRRTALERLRGALAGLDALGVPTSAGFTRALLALPEVGAGELDTGLLERVLAGDGGEVEPPADLLAAGALAAFLRDADAHAAATTVPFGWGAPVPWRRRFEDAAVAVAGTPAGCEIALDGGDPRPAAVRWLPGEAPPPPGAKAGSAAVEVALDGVARRYAVAWEDGTTWAGRDGYQRELRPAAAAGAGAAHGVDGLEAPMPGTVLDVKVSNGDAVAEGEVLVVLESMKMELSIVAPHDGVVADLELAAGDRVAQRQALLTVGR
ncbi:MAG: ATP-grasp domain-containing protein [Solirubrobacterales bacterium]|nr:ATP-grasp domain-containing protein [Solirubrobacterales bacterium]